MKEFRKNKDGYYMCEECGQVVKNEAYFGRHILIHGSKEKYFEKWLKEPGDDICLQCGDKTKILKLHYNHFCSKSCLMKYRYSHGYIGFSDEMRDKAKQTWIKNLGVDNPSKSEKVKKKKEETNLKKYGNISALGNKEIREKRKKTNKKRYGFEHPQQNTEIFNKIQKKLLLSKKFRDTALYYQASYELDFLEKYYDLFRDIQRGPAIKFNYEGKIKIYFPDFYIPSLNLIVEIKSSYHYNRYKNLNKYKKIASIHRGYKYILIMDKNYSLFNKKYLIQYGTTSTL